MNQLMKPNLLRIRLRRCAVGVACVLALSACEGPATDAATHEAGTARGGNAEARRAAAQLEIEALPGAGGGPFEGRELDPPLAAPQFTLTDTGAGRSTSRRTQPGPSPCCTSATPAARTSARRTWRRHPSDVLAYTGDHRGHVSYPFGSPPSAFAGDLPQLIDSEWNA